MFDPGTKVVVLASSIKKGTTGPRKGSVGYINSKARDSNTVAWDESTRLLTGMVDITFSRYGFEKSNRRETKNVCNFIPVPLRQKNGVIENAIDDIVQKMETPNFLSKMEYVLQQGIPHETINKKPIVILGVPDCCGSNLVDCSHNEFCCWFESILINNTTNINRIQHIYEGNYYAIGLNISLESVKLLLDCVYSNDQRRVFYETVKKDKALRIDAVTTIRKICTITDKRVLNNLNFLGVASSFSKSNINYNTFYNYFAGNLFTLLFPTLVTIAKKEMDNILKRDNMSDSRISQYKKAITKGGTLIDNIYLTKKHTSKLALSLLNA